MTDSTHVFDCLCRDGFLKFIGQVIVGTGVHHVLPDHKPQLITQIVEKVVRIPAAAPDADHVEMAGL